MYLSHQYHVNLLWLPILTMIIIVIYKRIRVLVKMRWRCDEWPVGSDLADAAIICKSHNK